VIKAEATGPLYLCQGREPVPIELALSDRVSNVSR
jgi:hypothetical protein